MRHITGQSFGNRVDWAGIAGAIDAGHRFPTAQIEDVFLGPPGQTLLSRDTTLHDIDELESPLETGAISDADYLADLCQLNPGQAGRTGPDDITVFRNGGGAHLDLMTASGIPEHPEHPTDKEELN